MGRLDRSFRRHIHVPAADVPIARRDQLEDHGAREQSFGPEAVRAVRPPSRRGPRRFSPRARKVWELSIREAVTLGHRYLGSEHLLLGLLREGNGLAAKILTDAGLRLDELRAATLAALREAA